MFSCAERDAAAAIAPLQTFSLRALCRHAVAWMRSCRQRQRERQQLLDYMAIDHRAAADMGATRYDALSWTNRPFWRA